jgi:hypothetical protein
MDPVLDLEARRRGAGRCEYCRLPESAFRMPFVLDHIIARQRDGRTELMNLALCCGRCNLHKGPNIASIDPQTGNLSRLFNPRLDVWAQHFRWEHTTIKGITEIGRATIVALSLNDPAQIARRRTLIATGQFPPP